MTSSSIGGVPQSGGGKRDASAAPDFDFASRGLSLLEAEYRMVLAATRGPAGPEAGCAEDGASDEELPTHEGYSALGFDALGSDDEDEDDETGAADEGEGAADGADGHPQVGGGSIGADERERPRRRVGKGVSLAGLEGGGPIAAGPGSDASASDDEQEPPGGGSWTADFSPASEPLPAERAELVKKLMAGLSLAPPPPPWAQLVPEPEWRRQLAAAAAGKGPGEEAHRGAARGRAEVACGLAPPPRGAPAHPPDGV